ncbi:FAD-dependent oxidoreductase [Roseomonas alkaliterrae]|uniref:3-oxosteroid 1-dehydrogenase n=1 Tax=Neoroseomonas alkaliterrae TaxID=1452450 RepID=A0A840Y4A8_9PROT|nr:FAD-dependent oxidoreductase [Neoroseomonas alkaliterrae]MBB5689462.1 3-oxosteroid 1-dehydrogenase [Neoroseomonas alkaliterrae]MBR0675815.1 FAD-dependent oxidoreductase [Neoroseomonas alkaliterrae]
MRTDVLVLGSGSAGLVAALTAARRGLSVTVLEKTDRLGGTTAMSGAGTWIPANHHAAAAGIADSAEEALAYIRAAAPEGWAEAEDALWRAFVAAAPEMLRFVEAETPLRFALTPEPDPLRDLPGAKARGRMLSPLPLSRWRAGRFAFRIRRSTIPEIFTYHEAVTTDLYHRPYRTALALWPRLLWRLLTNTRGKGTALVTGLLRGCLDAGVEVLLNARAVALTQDADGAVTGATVERNGAREAWTARRGVVLATGGFEWDAALMARHFPGPLDYRGSPAAHEGDGQRMAAAAGAALERMDQATITPSVPTRYEGRILAQPVPFHTEPNAMLVNRHGLRFVNELTFNIGEALDARNPASGEPLHLPAWIITDARMLDRVPPVRWAAKADPSWLRRAPDIAALAGLIGVPAVALAASLARFNAAAEAGHDADFGRPARPDPAAAADRRRRAGIEPIATPPFLAMPFSRSILGTKGGARTNEHAEVLRPDGSVIPGLFAAGLAMANPIGTRNVGTGTTIGPNMTWGYIAGRRLAQRN